MRRILLFSFATIFCASSNAQVISQIYGGGGNSQSTFSNDFIEVFNNTPADINLNGFSVQYAASGSTNAQFLIVANLSGTLLRGQYYLVQAGGGSANTGALPTPDATGATDLSARDGKVILVNTTSRIAIDGAGCPVVISNVTIRDFVGYGQANCSETNPAPRPSATNRDAVLRNGNGCQDNGDNSLSFTVVTPPTPRNTSNQRWDCIAGAPLPVNFANLRAVKKGTVVSIQFSNLTEEDIARYSIERSASGRGFVETGRLTPQKNNNTEASYTWEDKAPQGGVNLYRIKAVETNGKQIISGVLKVDLSATGTSLQIVPNPVRGQTLGLQVSNLPAGLYQVHIFSANVQAISTYSIQHSGGSFTQNLPLRGLQPGQYLMRLEGAVRMQQSFLVQQ